MVLYRDGNGTPRLSLLQVLTLAGGATAVASPLIAMVVWFSTTIAELAELRNRFNASQTHVNEALARLDAHISRLDTQGGRQLGIVTEKQLLVIEAMRSLRTDLDALRNERK